MFRQQQWYYLHLSYSRWYRPRRMEEYNQLSYSTIESAARRRWIHSFTPLASDCSIHLGWTGLSQCYHEELTAWYLLRANSKVDPRCVVPLLVVVVLPPPETESHPNWQVAVVQPCYLSCPCLRGPPTSSPTCLYNYHTSLYLPPKRKLIFFNV